MEQISGDETFEAVSPTATDPDVNRDVTNEQDAPEITSDPQSSSGPDPAEQSDTSTPNSMEEAISAALKKPDDGEPDPDAGDDQTEMFTPDEMGDKTKKSPAEKSNGAVEKDGSGEELADPTDEELSALKPKTLKRVQSLLAQRNEARRDADDLRTDAGNYRQIRQFMETSNLVDREVADLFKLGADLKSGDPKRLAGFLDRAMPVIQSVLEATGRSVPADMHEQVERGELTEDAAKRFGAERFHRGVAEQRAQQASQALAARDQATRTTGIQSAIATWEQQVRASDPDFDLKAKAMERAALALVARHGGLPQSPEQALEFARRAYEEVNEDFKRARPAPKATKPTPSPTAGSAALKAAPTSLEEIIKGALAGGRSR